MDHDEVVKTIPFLRTHKAGPPHVVHYSARNTKMLSGDLGAPSPYISSALSALSPFSFPCFLSPLSLLFLSSLAHFPYFSPPSLSLPSFLSLFDLYLCCRHVGGAAGGPCERVLAVLQDPPKKVPRSPTLVRATLAEVSCLDSEDAGPPVEVRWRVPSQASLAPASCGDIERYYVKCWWRGKGKEVMRTKTSTVDVPRRDFCRNQVNATGVIAAYPLHPCFRLLSDEFVVALSLFLRLATTALRCTRTVHTWALRVEHLVPLLW